MSLEPFQILCLAVLAAAYGVDVWRSEDRAGRARDIGLLAVSAWLGEQTVIAAYAYYGYDTGWWLVVGHVPLLVPLIWPLVVLSARDVVGVFWPGGGPFARAMKVGAVVIFDASIMEVVAVAAGYWQWAEGGYFGVPLMGIVGWGCFGVAASLWFDRGPGGFLRWLMPVVTVVAVHAAILLLWWCAFRWGPRRDLGPVALAGFGGLALIYATAVLRARAQRGTGALPAGITLPRVLATSVFVALLATLAVAHGPYLWGHLGLAAVPYLIASAPGQARRSLRSDQEDVLG